MNMSAVKLPLIELAAGALDTNTGLDNQQVNPSSLMAYLGIRGIGRNPIGTGRITRQFNATDVLSYFDIYKNYYANTQEANGYIIHKNPEIIAENISTVSYKENGTTAVNIPQGNTNLATFGKLLSNNTLEYIRVNYSGSQDTNNIILYIWRYSERTKTETIERVLINDILTNRTTGTGNYEFSGIS